MLKHNSDVFFCCSLIEFIGRACHLKRLDVARALGKEDLKRIYQNAGILHCEPIAKTADVYVTMLPIKQGTFDNVGACEYAVPDYWTIGEVYARLIEDIGQEDVVQEMFHAYEYFISDAISNYNSDFYYQPRDYIYACYKENQIL